jgi:alanyl-tRNA synthetase
MAVLTAVVDGKPLIIVAVTEDLNQRGLKAGDIVGKVAKIVGGGGGGRPTLAQAGGKDPDKLPEALAAVHKLVLPYSEAWQKFVALPIKNERNIPLLSGEVEVADISSLREMASLFRERGESGLAVLATIIDNKLFVEVAVTEDLIGRQLKADDIARDIAEKIDGSSDGQPTLAEAFGTDPGKLRVALDSILDLRSVLRCVMDTNSN